jgi:hypothetical protein
VLPADSFAKTSFAGAIRFAGIELEQTMEIASPAGIAAFEETICYVPGTTGMEVGFSGRTKGAVLGFNEMLEALSPETLRLI